MAFISTYSGRFLCEIFKTRIRPTVFKNSDATFHKTLSSLLENIKIMLFMEIYVVYCENYAKHKNAPKVRYNVWQARAVFRTKARTV